MTQRYPLQLDAPVYTRSRSVLQTILLLGSLCLNIQGRAQTITITSTNPNLMVPGGHLCQSFGTVQVNFNRTGNFGTSNEFELQLSDGTGSFAAPLVIGMLAVSGGGNVAGTIIGSMPYPGPAAGPGYRLRIQSANAPQITSNNTSSFSLDAFPTISLTQFQNFSICESGQATIPNGAFTAQDYGSITWSSTSLGEFAYNTLVPTYFPPSISQTLYDTLLVSVSGTGACANVGVSQTFAPYVGVVTVTPLPEAIFTGTLPLAICENSGPAQFQAITSNTDAFDQSWLTTGAGIFNYFFAQADYNPVPQDAEQDITIQYTVTGIDNCSNEQLTVSHTFHVDGLPQASVNQIVPVPLWCSTSGPHQIDASANATNASSFTWFVDPTLGSFNDPSLLAPLFTPAPTAGGNIPLSFIAYGEGACATETSSADFFVQLSPGAVADIATSPQTTCGQTAVAIEGYASGPGMWSNFQGTFSPNANTIDAIYTPAANEVGTTVTLVWTTNDPDGWQACPSVSDQVSVEVNTPATANAGDPYTACGTAPVNLTATANGSGSWSGGTGTFGNPNSASTTYTPAPSEVGNTVQLTWITTDPDANGPCGAVPSTATLTVVTPPNAGSDGTYAACSNDEPFELFIHLGGSPQAGGSWTFDNNSVNGTFTPGTSPEGEYTYTVLPLSGCPNVATATVTVTETTAANAGEYNIVNLCDLGVSVNLIALLGSNITTGGTWNSTLLTGSNGTFNPQADSSGTYTYTVQPNGPCPADTASVTVTIVSAADAGNDTTLYFCSIGEAVLLNSLSGNWTSGYWVDPQYGDTLGDNLEYDPSTMDYNSLMFVATTQSPCPSDEAIVFIIENPAPATPEINSVDLVMNSDTVCRGQYPSLITPAITGASYTWSCTAWEPDTVDGTNLNTIAPQWSSEPGQYTITLTVVDPAGCSNTGERTVTLLPDSASCPKGIFYFEPHGLGVLDDQARWFEWGTVNTSQSTFVPDPTVQGYQSQTMFDPDQLAAYAGGLPTNPFYAVRTSRYPDGHCSSFTTQWVTQELLDRACLLDNGGFGPDLGYRVYPNPVTAGELTVEALGQPSVLPVEATLYDLGGRLMYTEQLPAGARATLRTDLGALGQGVYVLRLRNAQLENTFKVIIQ